MTNKKEDYERANEKEFKLWVVVLSFVMIFFVVAVKWCGL